MTKPITELKAIAERADELSPDPLIAVQSVAHRRDGTICGQTEVLYFVTTEAMRTRGASLFSTPDENLARFIAESHAAVPQFLALLARIEYLEEALARVRSNSSIPHRVKQICDEVLTPKGTP